MPLVFWAINLKYRCSTFKSAMTIIACHEMDVRKIIKVILTIYF